MNKIHTVNQLQDFLDAELSWRVKEIANLKTAVKQSGAISEKTIVRAGLALLYAHWEGFVKNSVTGYLNFVDCQGLRYSDLQSCFIVFGLKKSVHELVESRKSPVTIAALDFLRQQLQERAQLKIDAAINTESNLSSTVFHNILLSVGFDPTNYETKSHLIDVSLLKRRNNIAHGEYLDVAASDWRHLADEIISMLRQLKSEIENAVVLSSFRRSVHGPQATQANVISSG
jgi:hypothetical protein